MSTHSYLTPIFFCLSFIISFAHAINGISVELIHRDSLKSPFRQPTQRKYQHIVNALHRSINRLNYFYKDSITNTPKSTVIRNNYEYLMSYSVGTPPFHVLGLVDTGSDTVWLQCEPCEQCYNQTNPIFNPLKSSSYKNIPCTSKLCTSCSKNNYCEYTVNYGDESRTHGDLSLETLTLDSTTGNSVSFPKTIIGCGHSNTGTFKAASSGIVGLGNGALSLTKQLKTTIGEKFSYCLVPHSPESNASSILNFGDAALVSGDGVVSTPIVIKEPLTFYYLTLEALSVGDKRIKFGGSSSVGDEGNIVIDSGTTLTFLPYHVYNDLESALVELVKLKRVDDPDQYLNLCYSLTSDKYDFPIITAHFQGADVKLEPISTFVKVADDIVCLAFHTSGFGGAIFGSLVQQNLLVGYDLQKKTISFKPTDCTKLNSM